MARLRGPFPCDRKRAGRVRVKPVTRREWQEAADCACFALALHSAYQYGILTGPAIDTRRCYRVLAEAAKLNIRPLPLKEILARA